MSKERIVVVCPGRGTYTANELNFFGKYGQDHNEFIGEIDEFRTKQGQAPIQELDAMPKFKRRVHTLGENSASLIYACSMIDFMSIDQDKYEIVAIAGNSMGWYISLACAGVLNPSNAINVVNTMGSMMKDGNIGGQIVYPLIDENWVFQKDRLNQVEKLLIELNKEENVDVYISIFLGGNLVLAGNDLGVKRLLEALEGIKLGDVEYPFQLLNHAAFHTPILSETSNKAKEIFKVDQFESPQIPLVDGRGKIWQPYSTDLNDLYEYTLGHQVYAEYDFTKSIEVSVKEFAPDRIVLLGPGSNLGGSIAQTLIMHSWHGISNKAEFIKMQKNNPYVVAMGREDQRKIVV